MQDPKDPAGRKTVRQHVPIVSRGGAEPRASRAMALGVAQKSSYGLAFFHCGVAFNQQPSNSKVAHGVLLQKCTPLCTPSPRSFGPFSLTLNRIGFGGRRRRCGCAAVHSACSFVRDIINTQ
jgi:hypothetical protein